MSYSRGSSQHRETEPVPLTSPVLAGGYFTTEPPGKPFSNLPEDKILAGVEGQGGLGTST